MQSGVCSILANLIMQTEELRELGKVFVSWDTNKDGRVSLSELESNMKDITSYFNLDQPDVQKLMDALDADKDGYIDYTEFITGAIDKKKLLTVENLRKAFSLLDVDSDGAISRDELRAAFNNVHTAESDDFWEEVMQQVDINQDGLIQEEEFTAHMIEVYRKRATFY